MNVRFTLVLLLLLSPVVFGGLGHADVQDSYNNSDAKAPFTAKGGASNVTTVWSAPELDSTLTWAKQGPRSFLFVSDGTDLLVVNGHQRDSVRLPKCGDATAIWYALPQQHGTTFYLVGNRDGSVVLMRPDGDDNAEEVARLSVFDSPISGFAPAFGRPTFGRERIGVSARGETSVKLIDVSARDIHLTDVTLAHNSIVEAVVSPRITADARGTLRGWSESGEEVWSESLHRGGIAMMVRGPGYIMSVGSRDNTLKLFNFHQRKVEGEVRLQRGVVSMSAVSEEPAIAVAYENGTVEMWERSAIVDDSRRRPRAAETVRVGSGKLLAASRINHYLLVLAFEGEKAARVVQIDAFATPDEIPGRGTLPDYIYPAVQQETRKYGFIDISGRLVIEPVFSHVDFPQVPGIFRATFSRRNLGVFDRDRKWVVNPPFTEDVAVLPIGPERVRVYTANNRRYHLVDFDNNRLNERDFRDLKPYREGRAVFQAEDRFWGVLDIEGNVVIEPDFLLISDFAQGRAIATTQNEGTILIDRDGNKVGELATEGAWDGIQPIGDGLVAINDLEAGESRVFDLDGNLKFTIEGEDTFVLGFAEGYGRLARDGEFFYIDREGNIVKRGYADGSPHIDGVAIVMEEDRTLGLIDRNFNWLTRGHTESMRRHPGPFFSVHGALGTLKYYLNAQGKRIEFQIE